MRLVNKILIASTNRDKYEEFKALLSAYPGIELLRADKVIRNSEALSYVERHDTYLENALAKARLATSCAHYPALADDSGLEVRCLEGKPGVRSHRYATPRAGMSQDEANTARLLEEMRGKSDRQARFVCTLALAIEGLTLHTTGTLEGTILETPRGVGGFGYDPVFLPKGQNKTLAEMTSAEKNSLSHRAVALHELMAQLKGHGLVLAKP